MKYILVIILFVAVTGVSIAGTNDKETVANTSKVEMVSVTGSILDKNTAEPLVGVKVSLEGTEKVAYTDFDGNYQFEAVKPGKYNLKASYVSYNNKSVEGVKIDGENHKVNLELELKN